MRKSRRGFASGRVRGVRRSCRPRLPRLPSLIWRCGRSVMRRVSVSATAKMVLGRELGYPELLDSSSRYSPGLWQGNMMWRVCLTELSRQCRNRTRWGGSKETGARSAWRSAFQVTSTKTHRPWRPPPGCSSGSLYPPSFPSSSSSPPSGSPSSSPCHALPYPSWPCSDCASGE